MIDERQQFRILYRDFLARLIDLDVLSAGGDPQRLFVHFAAVLTALGFVLTIYLIPGYTSTPLPHERLLLAATGDQQFLASFTMAITGIFGVLAWGAIFPDRRDSLILGTLPVRPRVVFLSKIAAVGSGLAVSVVAANLFIGISYPFVVPSPVPGVLGTLRTFAGYWLTMFAAGGFVFAVLLGVQGVTLLVLPYRYARRLAAFEQVAALFAIFGTFLLTPGGSLVRVTDPASRPLMAWFPSYWFLGLYQQISGPAHPVFEFLAARALAAIAISAAAAAACYALVYYRGTRAIVEQPDIAPSAKSSILPRLLRRPVDRAIVPFVVRTLARSSRHRLILAAYAGAAGAVALAYCRAYLFNGSALYAQTRRYMRIAPWDRPNVAFLAAGIVMLIAMVYGVRAVFALPSALRANWIFRVTAVHRPLAYIDAARLAYYLLAFAPLLFASAAVYFGVWQWQPALEHLLVFALLAVFLCERRLRGVHMIPFTRSYTPGKANLPVSLGVRGAAFLFLTDLGSRVELSALERRVRWVVLFAVMALLAYRAARKRAELASEPGVRLSFEDTGIAEIAPLDFRRDGIWGGEKFLDEVPPPAEVSWKRRIAIGSAKAAAAVACVCLAGGIWEEVEDQRERRSVTQVGRSVDIGGRSLNVSCMGEGPAVLLESGGGGVGYYWIGIQRELAKFSHACWYDRAGAGWSDPAPYPRDSIASARDLDALVKAGGVSSPMILVGSSLGGLIARVYASQHPETVTGIVLVDSSHVDEGEPIPPAGEWVWPPWAHRASVTVARVLWRIGALRFFFGDDDPGGRPKWLDDEDWRIVNSFGPRGLVEFAKVPFEESLRQARAAPRISGVPMIVLTAGLPPRRAENPVEARKAVANQKKWIEAQQQLLSFTTPSHQVVVSGSSHCIACMAPESIVLAIRELIEKTKSGGSPSL